jgi:endonuclease VIII
LPEGDSLHRIARRLQVLVGERVEAESPNPRGLATGVARAVDGRVLECVEAVGKNLLLRFDGGVVVRSHLRMSGRWRVRERGGPAWRGAPWLVLSTAAWEATQWNGPVLAIGAARTSSLGPDLLAPETEMRELVARLRQTDQSRLVGEALVDQRLVAGIGNMWLAELLWHARESPWARLGEVPDEALSAALDWAREAMAASVAGRRPSRAVYRRAGRGCRRCGEAIRAAGLGGTNRTIYWCARCQPGGKAEGEGFEPSRSLHP